MDATSDSSCVSDAIAASSIAVSHVAGRHGCSNDVTPTAATSKAPKVGSTTAIASSAIAAGNGKRA